VLGPNRPAGTIVATIENAGEVDTAAQLSNHVGRRQQSHRIRARCTRTCRIATRIRPPTASASDRRPTSPRHFASVRRARGRYPHDSRSPAISSEPFDLTGQPSARRHQLRPRRSCRRGPRRDSPVSCAARLRLRPPSAGAQELAPAANRPGLRHIAFTVDDVRGVVDRVREAGWETVGEIVDFENTFLLCYLRGPEGLIVEIAERLDGPPG
jgi:catechol 2,3-dioxygenase-like lactoylglutathione lyase family enzyme